MEENIKYLIKCSVSSQVQFAKISSQLQDTQVLLTSNQERVTHLEQEVTSLNKELKVLKEVVNTREQVSRNLVIRINGVPQSEDETHGSDAAGAAAKTAYDRVLRPILAAAKTKAIIATLPTLNSTIVKAYRMGSRTSPPRAGHPPIVVTLASSAIKLAIFRAKKGAMPALSDADKAAGSKSITMAEDLTPPSYQFLQKLREDKRVARAWTVDGAVRYVREDDKDGIVRKVRSIYDPLDSILA